MVIVLVHREIRNLPVFATIVRKWDIVKKIACGNGNEAAERMCLGFEIFDSEMAYEEVLSMEECPNSVGCCMFCNTVGPAYAVCLTCPPESQATYHPLTITRYQPNDARTQDKELADLVVTRLMSSKVDEELESFFGLVGEVLYKDTDPDHDGPTFYVRVTCKMYLM
jgi:hypothetical protein